MSTWAQEIEQAVGSWPGIVVAPHRFGGVEFRLAGHELGHLHGSELADLPLPRRVRDEVIAAGLAEPHHIFPDSGWVSCYLLEATQVQVVIALFRRNYDRIVHVAPTGNREASMPSDVSSTDTNA